LVHLNGSKKKDRIEHFSFNDLIVNALITKLITSTDIPAVGLTYLRSPEAHHVPWMTFDVTTLTSLLTGDDEMPEHMTKHYLVMCSGHQPYSPTP